MPGTGLLVIILGLASALFWGAGDFSGGLATKRTSAFSVVALSQSVSFVILLLAAFLIPDGSFSIEVVLIGGLAGVCGAVGLVALYSGLARGPMGVVAPVTAVVAAIVPVLFSFIQNGVPGYTDTIAIGIALVAVWLFSQGAQRVKYQLADLSLPLIAGLGFGLFFILIDRVSEQAILWPLISARSASVIIVFMIGMLTQKIERPARNQFPVIVLAGILDTAGNIFYALASRYGRLDIAAILASLYPASTVFLAWIILNEKLTRRQWVGVILVLTSVTLIAI